MPDLLSLPTSDFSVLNRADQIDSRWRRHRLLVARSRYTTKRSLFESSPWDLRCLVTFIAMQLILDERVEKALRHLAPREANRARDAMRVLEYQKPETVRQLFPKLQSQGEPGQLFLLRVTPRLRAIFRYSEDGSVVIEDLVSHDVLTRHFLRQRAAVREDERAAQAGRSHSLFFSSNRTRAGNIECWRRTTSRVWILFHGKFPHWTRIR
jgi:hypothetical protein